MGFSAAQAKKALRETVSYNTYKEVHCKTHLKFNRITIQKEH
jgi:hypothetical protein